MFASGLQTGLQVSYDETVDKAMVFLSKLTGQACLYAECAGLFSVFEPMDGFVKSS